MFSKSLTLFIILLFSTAYSLDLSGLDFLENYYQNPVQFSDSNSASDIVERIKVFLIQAPATKQALLDNASDLETTRVKLLRCVEEFMKRNQFKAIEKLIQEVLDPLDLDLSTDMRLVGNQIKKEIDNIVNVAHAKRNTQIITPVFQWIQSKTHVFLQIKFAHRHDAPGCLEVKNDRIEFKNNGFYFSAFGVQAQQPIHFVLNLTLAKEIIPEESSWNLESVGRLFVSIAKAEHEVWGSLLENNEKLPGMRLWWEMKDKYKDVMREYEKLVEQQEDAESENKKAGKKKKKQEEQPFQDEL